MCKIKLCACIFNGIRPLKPEELQSNGPLVPTNLIQQSEDALCPVLVEIIVARDKRSALLTLKPRPLLTPHNYMVMIMLGTKVVWTSSLSILDSGGGPNQIKENFVLT